VIEELRFLHPARQVGMSGQHSVELTRAGSPRTDTQKVRQRHFLAAHRLSWKLHGLVTHRRICGEVNKRNLTSEKRSNKSGADWAEISPDEAV